MNDSILSPFLGEHDHDVCQQEALANARKKCADQGLKLTPLRQQVLEIIWNSHHPVGAYEVLQVLQESGHKPAPPTAYRALEFLVMAKLVHRIESLNAYIGCPSPNAAHQCQFYICRECGVVAETNNQDLSQVLKQGAQDLGFVSEQSVVEIHGLCRNCQ